MPDHKVNPHPDPTYLPRLPAYYHGQFLRAAGWINPFAAIGNGLSFGIITANVVI